VNETQQPLAANSSLGTIVNTKQFCETIFTKEEMWCWRMVEKISWTDDVRNEEVLL
jgi:hypothetical protein